jgi:phage tail-like protein
MRGSVDGLLSPHPLLPTLPGIYQDQPFLAGFLDALDEVLAPVTTTLDNLPAYLDVATAPDDLLPWLALWIGMPSDVARTSRRRREVLHAAARLHGWQGTRRGVESAVESMFGFRTVVEETGAASWSLDPGSALPGEPMQAIVVRVFVPPDGAVDQRRLDALVMALKPAHVVHRVEVLPETEPPGGTVAVSG